MSTRRAAPPVGRATLGHWTVEAGANLKAVSEPSFSADGTLVAFAIADSYKPSPEREPPSRLWAVPTAGGAPFPLTAAGGRDLAPRWSPRGDSLAFLSPRGDPKEEQLQIHLLPARGGDARQLTRVSGQITAHTWAADGSRVFFLLAEPSRDRGPVRRHEAVPVYQRLWSVDVRGGKPAALSPPGVQVWEFAASPDGSRHALVASPEPWAWSWYHSRLYLLNNGSVTLLFDPDGRQLARPAFSPDGSHVAFLTSSWSDRGCVLGGDVYVAPVAGGSPRNLTSGYAGSAAYCEWLAHDRLLFCGYEGSEATIGTLAETATPRLLWKGQAAFLPRLLPSFSRRGQRLAFARESFGDTADLWLATLSPDGVAWRRLTRANPGAQHRTFAETEVVRWPSFDGIEIEGILVKPLGYQPGRRFPLVVGVHGGPTNMAACRMQVVWEQVLASMGCAVLWPNFRGSTGRGLAFSEANLGDMGGGDFRDVMAGVDHCLGIGLADPERLGITGQSYGGFLTCWAITQTDRFRAAVAGASMTNWRSFHGTSRLPTWDSLFLQATPDQADVYARWSPVEHARRAHTPTLLLHGAEDEDVPAGQSYEMYRALKDHGVETELRIYPRERHGFRERTHVIDRDRQTIAWLARHLGLPTGPGSRNAAR